LPFFNSSGIHEYDYIKSALNDSLLSSIDKTQKFMVMDQDLVIDKLKNNYFYSTLNLTVDEIREYDLFRISNILDAGLVIYGYYEINESTVKVYSCVYDASSRQVSITLNIVNDIKSKDVNFPDDFSLELSRKMEDKFPPLENIPKISDRIGIIGFFSEGIEPKAADNIRNKLSDKLISQGGFSIFDNDNTDMIFKKLELENKAEYSREEVELLSGYLKAGKIITGSVKRSGKGIIINIKLINTENNETEIDKYVILNKDEELDKALDYISTSIISPEKQVFNKAFLDFAQRNRENGFKEKVTVPKSKLIFELNKNLAVSFIAAGTSAIVLGIGFDIISLFYLLDIPSNYDNYKTLSNNDFKTIFNLIISGIALGSSLMVIGLISDFVSIQFFVKAYGKKTKAALNIGYFDGPVVSFSLKL
jgi:TolB-like protein